MTVLEDCMGEPHNVEHDFEPLVITLLLFCVLLFNILTHYIFIMLVHQLFLP